jgi:hypothetical protein
MFSPSPLTFTHPAVLAKKCPRKLEVGFITPADCKPARRQLVRYIRKHPIG